MRSDRPLRTYGHQFDVNCSILFTELPLLERPAAARAAGFEGIELWWPWEAPEPADKDADQLVTAIADAGVHLACLNFIAGDMAAGERGLLSVPAGRDAFRRNVPAATELAARLGCRNLNAPYGNRVDPADARLIRRQDELAIENLQLAADTAARADPGLRVLIEPINSADVPRYPIDSSAKARSVIDKSRRVNVRMLADLYHLATMSEDLSAALEQHADLIGHVQVADVPGRGAPGTGGLDFEPLFAQLAGQGYEGWVGIEHVPADPGDSAPSLAWASA
ncbi:MAG TPA: TIM barrel protein [Trebonia sp.]|nr:TIM barrel protein [Trebonia sp.]